MIVCGNNLSRNNSKGDVVMIDDAGKERKKKCETEMIPPVKVKERVGIVEITHLGPGCWA